MHAVSKPPVYFTVTVVFVDAIFQVLIEFTVIVNMKCCIKHRQVYNVALSQDNRLCAAMLRRCSKQGIEVSVLFDLLVYYTSILMSLFQPP